MGRLGLPGCRHRLGADRHRVPEAVPCLDASAPALIGYLLAYYAAFGLLRHVMRVMPPSMTYTAWNGLGAAALSGCVFFGDRLTAATATGITLAVAGAVLINAGGAAGGSRAGGRNARAATAAAECR